MSEHHKVILEEQLLTAYGKTWKERSDEQKEVAKYMDIVIECCANEQLVIIIIIIFIFSIAPFQQHGCSWGCTV